MPKDIRQFAELPPQGYAFMGPLERFDHKVRCAVLEVLQTGNVGTWNVNQVLGHIASDVEGLTAADEPPVTKMSKRTPLQGL